MSDLALPMTAVLIASNPQGFENPEGLSRYVANYHTNQASANILYLPIQKLADLNLCYKPNPTLIPGNILPNPFEK